MSAISRNWQPPLGFFLRNFHEDIPGNLFTYSLLMEFPLRISYIASESRPKTRPWNFVFMSPILPHLYCSYASNKKTLLRYNVCTIMYVLSASLMRFDIYVCLCSHHNNQNIKRFHNSKILFLLMSLQTWP